MASAAPSLGLMTPSDTARMMRPSASTASSANSMGGSSSLISRSRGRIRPSKNLSIWTSPALASSTALRTSASASPSSNAAATTVMRFLEPGLSPWIPVCERAAARDGRGYACFRVTWAAHGRISPACPDDQQPTPSLRAPQLVPPQPLPAVNWLANADTAKKRSSIMVAYYR